MSAWSDIWSQVQTLADTFEAQPAAGAVAAQGTPEGQAIASSSGFFGGVGAFLTSLTDGRTWASVGWILLGLLLTVAGLMLWLKKSNYLPSAVPLPV